MVFYRQKLLEAARALVAEGDLNMRLTHAAGCLLQIDNADVPAGVVEVFERVRDPLIQDPLVVKGEMLPRDLGEQEALAAAAGMLALLHAELTRP